MKITTLKINRMGIHVFIDKLTSKQVFRTCCLAIAFLITISCSSDDTDDDTSSFDCQAGTWTEWVENEFTAYYNAINVYSQDPTESNCALVESTAYDYLEALRDIVDCVPTANQDAINQAIDEAKEEVDSNPCG